jgi:hypothetical protein
MKKSPANPYLIEIFYFSVMLCFLLISGWVVNYFMPPDYSLNNEALKLSGGYAPLLLVVVGPMIETLLLQSLPGLIAQINNLDSWRRFLLFVLPFSVLHFIPEIPLLSLFNGLSAGVTFAFVYLRYIDKSHYKAIFATWLLHSGNNLLAFLDV